MRDGIQRNLVVDPAKTNIRISDDLDALGKAALAAAADRALNARDWNEIVR